MLGAVVQVRMGSTRLPNKALREVLGKPLLAYMIERLKASQVLDVIVIATTDKASDDPIAALAKQMGVPCTRGSEDDVLGRFLKAAQENNLTDIVRVTGDCPILDPHVLDDVLRRYKSLRPGIDYVSNAQAPRTFPDGQDVEVFSRSFLETLDKGATKKYQREHVTTYMVENPGMFKTDLVKNTTDLSDHRWTVDNEVDFVVVGKIIEALYPKNKKFTMQDVLDFLGKNPDVSKLNRHLETNEGFVRSLEKEGIPAEERERIVKMVLKRPGINVKKSLELHEKAKKLIPSGTQTFSKGPRQYPFGVSPIYLDRGQGSHVWDVDGNEFIDFPMALGSVILGHNYASVTQAAIAQFQKGTTFTLNSPLEVEVAEKLNKMIPCAEMVRFGKNGSDATSGAVRAARAFTGREKIATCGYHGWQDWYISTTTRNKGVPAFNKELVHPFGYNDIESLKALFAAHKGEFAAVIMEPMAIDEPQPGFLAAVRDLAHAEGALLIFDEIVTGFRLHKGGAQSLFGVTPDMASFGKALGNGMPIAVVAGRRDVMAVFDEIFFSFTFGGEAVSLAVANAVLDEFAAKPVVEHIGKIGGAIRDGYNRIAKDLKIDHITTCVGRPERTAITFKPVGDADMLTLRTLFQQEAIARGLLAIGVHNPCFSHSEEDVKKTLEAYEQTLAIMKSAIEANDVKSRLRGDIVEPVFRPLKFASKPPLDTVGAPRGR